MKKEWSEIVTEVVDKGEEWKRDGRAYFIIVDNGKDSNEVTANYGGNVFDISTAIASLILNQPRFAIILKAALEIAERHNDNGWNSRQYLPPDYLQAIFAALNDKIRL